MVCRQLPMSILTAKSTTAEGEPCVRVAPPLFLLFCERHDRHRFSPSTLLLSYSHHVSLKRGDRVFYRWHGLDDRGTVREVKPVPRIDVERQTVQMRPIYRVDWDYTEHPKWCTSGELEKI